MQSALQIFPDEISLPQKKLQKSRRLLNPVKNVDILSIFKDSFRFYSFNKKWLTDIISTY